MATCKECGNEFTFMDDTGICFRCAATASPEPTPTPMHYPAHGARFDEDVLINGVRYGVKVMTPTTVQLELRLVPITGEENDDGQQDKESSADTATQGHHPPPS